MISLTRIKLNIYFFIYFRGRLIAAAPPKIQESNAMQNSLDSTGQVESNLNYEI